MREHSNAESALPPFILFGLNIPELCALVAVFYASFCSVVDDMN